MSSRRPRIVFLIGWAALAVTAHLLWRDLLAQWSPWVALPLLFVAYAWSLDLLLHRLGPRDRVFFFEDLLRAAGVFVVLAAIALPLLRWAETLAGSPLTPAVPLAAAYLAYTCAGR